MSEMDKKSPKIKHPKILASDVPEEIFVTLRNTVLAYKYGKVNMFATELYDRQPWFSRYDNGVTVLPSSLAVSAGQEAIYSYSQIRVI